MCVHQDRIQGCLWPAVWSEQMKPGGPVHEQASGMEELRAEESER